MSYKVVLSSFEGPFDLLVYLIESAKMSIYDIQISEITEQYVGYLNDMKEADIAVSAEFMVLAATLIEIKSRMILPRMSEEGIDATIEDPRNELVERLLEYKRFRQMSDELGRRFEENCLIYEKPTEDISIYTENPDEVLNLSMESFISTFKLFLEREKRVAVVKSHYQKVEHEKASIESRISFIKDKIKNAIKGGIKKLSLKDLVPNKKSRYDVIVTFASVLQMMKDRHIRAEQDKMYGEISISTEGTDESKEAIDVQ